MAPLFPGSILLSW